MGGNSGSHASHGASKLSPPIGFDPGRSEARVALEAATEAAIVDDVSEVIARTRYIIRYPAKLFGKGLASELDDAVDRLVVKVAELREAYGADR